MPAWPQEVQTCTLVFGKGVTLDGGLTSARLTIRPIFTNTRSAVWAATGTPLLDFTNNYTAAAGQMGSVVVPVVDQPGWVNDRQEPYSSWMYRITEMPVYGRQAAIPRVKYWQPSTGAGTVDFDTLTSVDPAQITLTDQAAPPAVTAGKPALAKLDLVISRGSTNQYHLRYKTGSPAVPVNLTGWHAAAQFRSYATAATAWVTLTDPGSITLTTSGDVTITIPTATTQAPAWQNYTTGVWDLELTDPSGNTVRLVEGAVTVSQDITRV